jgi:hypothetical protein
MRLVSEGGLLKITLNPEDFMDYAAKFRPTPHLPVAESNQVFPVGNGQGL